jgi:hypothetical protein
VRSFVTKKSGLGKDQFEELARAFSKSPLVASSTLSGVFESTRGFDCIFQASGRSALEHRFAAVRPWLDLALGGAALELLRPWWARKRIARMPNAWYLNVLSVPPRQSVKRHVDATLRKPSQVENAVPEVVSVLYLSVPKRSTGALHLFDGAHAIARINPRENYCVHFAGHLAHEVTVNHDPVSTRISLVIEQYHFEQPALDRLPVFKLESRAGFGAFLELHHGLSASLQRDE